jgi:hypothetical protein
MIGLPDDDSKLDNPYSNDSASTPLLPASQGRRSPDHPPQFQSNGPTPSNNVIDIIQEDTWPQYGGEAPPEFAPYEAQHWVNADGNIVSHDPHLNEDGLYLKLSLECFLTISYSPRRGALSLPTILLG